MVVTIEADLVSSASPQPVQITINGMTPGSSYAVVGSTAVGASWPVPGGEGVADGGQLILVDNRSALNTAVVYRVTTEGATYAADPVTVSYDARYVIQSLDGQTSARISWIDNRDPRDLDLQSVAFSVPNRARPPVRFSAAGAGGGTHVMVTAGAETEVLRQLLMSGRPLVLRSDGILPFADPVELILPVRGGQRISGADSVYGDSRRWTIQYLLIDDPEPGTPLAAFIWDDFDAAWAGKTWDDHDAFFAGRTWDDWDRTDWENI